MRCSVNCKLMEAGGAVNRLTAIALTANENEAAPMSEPSMKEGRMIV